MPATSPVPLRILAALAVTTVACGGSDGGGAADTGSTWEHTTTTEGAVTTVHTTAGSIWGSDGHLVEELSIGQLEGPDEYAFGGISAIWPGEDRVYVADFMLNEVRAYDPQGAYLFDIGQQGQGPGEFERAAGVVELPDGRIAVHDGQKVLVYDHDGNYQEAWGSAENSGFRFMGPNMYAVTTGGDIYLRKMIMPEGGMRFGGGGLSSIRFEMRQALPGALGEGIEVPSFDYEQPTAEVRVGGNLAMMPVPFTASPVSAMMPDGGFVAGVPTDYQFEFRRPDGSTVVARKYWQPVPVNDGEVRLQMMRQRMVINGQTMEPDISGMEIPDTKPAYTALHPTRDGRVLVLPSYEVTVADECQDPSLSRDDIAAMDCAQGVQMADLFDADGGFLGSFEVPEGAQLTWGPWFEGDTLWMSVQDDLGTITVKRYRLVSPRDPADS